MRHSTREYIKTPYNKLFCYTMIVTIFFIFVCIILLDLLFFWVNQALLQKTIRNVQGKPVQIRILGALICYLALTAILYSTRKFTYQQTFLLGMGIYAVYEGTNYAIFQAWPLQMVILDTLWGGILFVLVKYFIKL
jgi:uncharacterized membrane protein